MSTERAGGCQCGRVRYTITGEPAAVYLCHCIECQRISGGAFSMGAVVAERDFRLRSGELKAVTRTSESGRPVQGFFCPECGTRIYHASEALPGVIRLRPGTLDDTSWLNPTAQYWARSRQPWLELPPGLQVHDTQPR